jgi:hypothetical protein
VSRDEYFFLMAYRSQSVLSVYVLAVFKFCFVFISNSVADLDPEPLVRDMDPDPAPDSSIFKQKAKIVRKTLILTVL